MITVMKNYCFFCTSNFRFQSKCTFKRDRFKNILRRIGISLISIISISFFLTLFLSREPHVVHGTFDSDVREPYVVHTSILFQMAIKLKTFEYKAIDYVVRFRKDSI